MSIKFALNMSELLSMSGKIVQNVSWTISEVWLLISSERSIEMSDSVSALYLMLQQRPGYFISRTIPAKYTEEEQRRNIMAYWNVSGTEISDVQNKEGPPPFLIALHLTTEQ